MSSSYNDLTSLLNNKSATAKRHDIGILRINGADAKKLLQGQMTCDINKLSSNSSLYGALCNIKGRIISSFYIAQKGDDILLLMEKSLVEATLLHLKKYAVFFKTELFNDSHAFHIYTHTSLDSVNPPPQKLSETLATDSEDNVISITLSHYPVNVQWLITDTTSNTIKEKNKELTELSILAARPIITKEQSEAVLPQWLNMQRTGGISFTKGCYTGQEIIARMQYRGKSKKQLALFHWKGTLDVTKELTDDKTNTIGNIISSVQLQEDQLAHAILNIDPNETQHVFLDGHPISMLPLPYNLKDDG